MSATLELLRAAQEGDRDACEQAVIENNGLIWSVVRRYYGRGVDPEDLYQLGCLGFLKAVQGFDFDYGTCFSTYAVPKIAGEIRRFLRDDGAVKVGRTMREQAQTLYTIRERLRQELGREPVLSELSEASGLTPEEIAQVEIATDTPESLQRETADGLTLEGMLGTDAPEEGMVERIALRESIDQLPEKERMTILLRYFKGLTQEQTARILGVSQGIFLTCFWGRRLAAGDVEVSLELQWSGLTSGEDSGGDGSRGELEQGNWSGVIHVCSSHEKNLRSRIEPFSETDENGVIVRAGYVIDMWEVPDRAPSGSGSITAGYGYPNEAGPIPEDFDIVFIVRYRDGEVTYSVREMGLLDPAG